MQHQLAVAGFGHRNEAVRTGMQAVDHGVNGITDERAHFVVKVKAIAFLGVRIIGETQMEHQIKNRVVINDAHRCQDFLAVAVPSAHQRLMILSGI